MKEVQRLLNTKEVAKVLNISQRTLYQWAWKKRGLRFVKVGRCLRVDEEDLRDFIEKAKTEIK